MTEWFDVHTHVGLDAGFYLRRWRPYACTARQLLDESYQIADSPVHDDQVVLVDLEGNLYDCARGAGSSNGEIAGEAALALAKVQDRQQRQSRNRSTGGGEPCEAAYFLRECRARAWACTSL